ncbi:MAG: hypothetical protein ACK5VE_03785 [Alphaproteobacteria bacterium]
MDLLKSELSTIRGALRLLAGSLAVMLYGYAFAVLILLLGGL